MDVAATRLAGQEARAGDHPRGDGSHRRAGDADAGAAPGRDLEALGALRHRRRLPPARPRRSRARARDHARGDRRAACLADDPQLSRPAADLVPHPDQGAGRGAAARRRPAHTGVHDEGLLHARSRPGRPRCGLREARGGLRPHLPALRADVLQGRVRQRPDGRHHGARVHGALQRGRGSRGALHRLRLRRERRDGGLAHRSRLLAAQRGRRRGRDSGRDDDRWARGLPRCRRAHDQQGDARRGRRRQGLACARARRSTAARAQAGQGAQAGHARRHARGDRGGVRRQAGLDRAGRHPRGRDRRHRGRRDAA